MNSHTLQSLYCYHLKVYLEWPHPDNINPEARIKEAILSKKAFEKVKELSIKLSAIENAAIRLAANIKKTQKRANALKNITIPKYEALTKDIQNALEEKEREEFTRLKVIKRMKQNSSDNSSLKV